MDEKTTERFAIRCARGNNGGEWATHYTEEQKEFWRAFVRDMAAEVLKAHEAALQKKNKR
jgi:hypothetical protein